MCILRNHVSPKREDHGAENARHARKVSTAQPDIAQTKRQPAMKEDPRLQRLEQDMTTENIDREEDPGRGGRTAPPEYSRRTGGRSRWRGPKAESVRGGLPRRLRRGAASGNLRCRRTRA